MSRSGSAADANAALPAAAVGLSALLLFVATACRGVFFGDSPELIAAASDLGVAHPPGYPLYTALGWLALAVPLGEPAFRMNLMSALCGATCVAGVFFLVRRWTGSSPAGVGASLVLAVSSTFWAVSTVAEVYTLHLLLVTCLLVVATPDLFRLDAGQRAVLAGAIVGLGLSHRSTILLALPAAWILSGSPGLRALRDSGARSRRCVLIGAGLAVAMPLALYSWLMFRAGADPIVHWGRPDRPAAVWAHLTAGRYGSYLIGVSGWFEAENLARLVREVGPGFGFLSPLIAGLGCVSAWFTGRFRRPLTAILALALPTLLFAQSYSTPDAEVLLLPTLLALALGTGIGIAAVQRLESVQGRVLTWLLVAATVLIPLAIHLPRRDLSRFSAADDYMRDVARTVPSGGVLFVEGDDAFLLAYLTAVLGERPDMTLYDRSGQLFRDEIHEPGPAMRRGEGRLSFRIRREQDYMRRHAASRPLLFLSWPGYSAPRGLRFEPVGLLQQVRRSGDPPREVAEIWASYREGAIQDQSGRIDSTFGLAVAARYPLMRAERAFFDGFDQRAVEELAQASRVGRDSVATHLSVGAIYGRLGEYASAIHAFEEAIRLQPVSIRAWNNLALAKSLAGDPDGARRAWNRSLAILPDQPEVRRLVEGGGG